MLMIREEKTDLLWEDLDEKCSKNNCCSINDEKFLSVVDVLEDK